MNSASGASAAPPFGANRSTNWRAERAEADAELGASLGLCQVAIGRGVALPSLENLRMLRHAGAVVVFDLVVDGHAVKSALFTADRQGCCARVLFVS